MSDTMNEEVEFDGDIFDQMVNGSFEETAVEDEEEDVTGEDDADDAETSEDDDQEDTDQDDDSEDEDETNDQTDDDGEDTLDDEDEDEEEDSLVDDDSSDDEDSDTEDEDDEEDSSEDEEEDSEDGVDEDTDEESEDETDTEEEANVADAETTDEIDYKAFYDSVVNAEFVVNGKKTKGFSDPKKIIQSQQMAGGFSEKMAGFKQYRPFMAPLKDRGMLDDQTKFDLAMNLVDGDKEAIKQHLKTLNIDPLELDMDSISYDAKSNVATKESIAVEDALERARGMGVEDRVRDVIGKEWDVESFKEFTTNPQVRNDLLTHIESGAYDTVQDKMNEMSRLDYSGSYGNMNTISKYRAAVKELQAEAPAPAAAKVKDTTPAKKVVTKKPSVKAEKAKIEQARKDEKYKEEVAKNEAKLNQKRKKAASISKKKPKAKPKAKFDPMAVEGEELDALMAQLISGGR